MITCKKVLCRIFLLTIYVVKDFQTEQAAIANILSKVDEAIASVQNNN